jgi:hypothetical protein
MYTYEIYDELSARVLNPDGSIYADAGNFYELEGASLWGESVSKYLNGETQPVAPDLTEEETAAINPIV